MTETDRIRAFLERGGRGRLIDIPPGYRPLFDVLMDAFDQAARGKGAERHANGLPFKAQPIFVVPALMGDTAGHFATGQAIKKATEALRLPPDRARAERLGAIVYISSLCLRDSDESR